MTDTEMWSTVVGFVSATFILPVIQQPGWSRAKRSLVTLAWSVLSAAVTAWLTGAFAGANGLRSYASALLFVFVTAITGYYGLARPLGVAPAIEAATSRRSARHAAPPA